MSDLDINIFELFDIEIVVIIAIVYTVIFERGLKHQIVRFTKLSAITEISTGNKTAE